MTEHAYRSRMIEDMTLRDLKPRTQEAYLLAAKQLVEYFGRPAAELDEHDLRAYFLHLREVRQLAPSTIKIAVAGVRFLFQQTLGRDFEVFELVRVKEPKRLPVVLSTFEVKALLAALTQPTVRMALTTIYALGLRLGEALALSADQIDSDRLTVWVRQGKGRKDRGVPLPRPLLSRLRDFWRTERVSGPTKILFARRGGSGRPLHPTTLQRAIKAGLQAAGIDKKAGPHSLRHSYATHLLEHGISLRTVQKVLGHRSLHTTERYLHVTQPATERLQKTVDQLVARLG